MIARTLCWVSKSITVLCVLRCCWLSLLRWWIRVQIVQRWVAQTIQISRYEAAVNTNIRPRPRTRASRGPGRRVIKPDIEQYRHPQSPGCPTIGKCWSSPAQLRNHVTMAMMANALMNKNIVICFWIIFQQQFYVFISPVTALLIFWCMAWT